MFSFDIYLIGTTMHKAFSTFNRCRSVRGVFLCICLFFISFDVANAQDCTPPFEMVTGLYAPVPGAPILWDKTFGDETSMESFTHVIEVNNSILAVGMRQVFSDVRPHLLFSLFDARGRDVWSKIKRVDNLKSIIDVHPREGGFVVLASQNVGRGDRAGFWVGFFTNEGEMETEKSFSDSKSSLQPRAIVADIENNGWIVSATSENVSSSKIEGVVEQTARLYSLDKSGEERIQRSYFLGGNSDILGLSVSKNFEGQGRYIATGRFDNNFGLSNAWVLRLRSDLSLEWQQEFRRGKSARIIQSVQDKNGYLLVAGDVHPRVGPASGVWFAMLGPDNGDVILQRYFYAEDARYNYSVRGLDIEESGRITLLMTASITGAEQTSFGSVEDGKQPSDASEVLEYYARLVYLSPRGIAIGGNVFAGVDGAQMNSFIRLSSGSVAMAGHAYMQEKPDYSKPFQIEDDVREPLFEEGHVNLPDADLAENTEKGLALLKKKIRAQDVVNKMRNSEESDKSYLESSGLTQDGWVVVAEPDPVYIDPCEK